MDKYCFNEWLHHQDVSKKLKMYWTISLEVI